MIIETLNPSVAEFIGAKDVEPKDLHSFTNEYISFVPILRSYLQAHIGETLPLLIKRIQPDTSFMEKIITGRIGAVSDNQFTFWVCEDMQCTYDEVMPWVLRFENALGNIPMLIELPDGMKIKKLLRVSPQFKPYMRDLVKMKKLLKDCIGAVHAAKLFYRYKSTTTNFWDGGYYVEAQILGLNGSNVELKHFRTFQYDTYTNLITHTVVNPFVKPDAYLQRVWVSFGVEHYSNPHDEN